MKLISFSERKVVAMNVTHDVIAEKIEEITGIEEGFLFCQAQKELFAALKDGFQNADIILLAVDVSRFVSTKAALFRALGFKCKLNQKITDLINSDSCMATLNENQIRAHAAIPVGGETFITNDGLFSGFGIKSGKQKLIVIPIDERRIGAVLENGLISFISDGLEKKAEAKPISDIPESMEGYVEPIENFGSASESSEEPQYEEIYKAPSEDKFEDVSSSSYEDKNASESADEAAEAEEYTDSDDTTFKNLSLIASKGVKIAFARMKDNSPYASLLAELEKSSAVRFVDFMTDTSLTEDDKRKEAAASNARKALKQTNADFAVSVSAVYRNEDGTEYVFATLADAQKSSVFKIFASENETAAELYRSGLESIIEKIAELSADMKDNSFSEAGEEEISVTEKKDISFATKIIIWLLIVVALCTLSALIIDAVMSGSASLGQSASGIIENTENLFLR